MAKDRSKKRKRRVDDDSVASGAEEDGNAKNNASKEVEEEEQEPLTEDKLTNWNAINGLIAQVEYSDEEEEIQESDGEKLQKFVSVVGPTYDNLGYALHELNASNQGIKSIDKCMDRYQHLRKIDLSKNKLESLYGIESATHLISLNASTNFINDISFFGIECELMFLTDVDLSHNKIVNFGELSLRRLKRLNLNNNEITFFEGFRGHETLEVLELRKNKLTSLDGFKNCDNLRELYLAENQIVSISGLRNCPKLEKIHLRGNPIEKLEDLQELPSLKYINLRQSGLKGTDGFSNMLIWKSLEYVNLIDAALTEEVPDARKELLMVIPSLKKTNKEEITPEERQEAVEELKQRKIEEEERKREEEERKREEEEERKRLEEEKRQEEEAKRLEEEAKKAAAAEQGDNQEGNGDEEGEEEVEEGED